MKTKQTMRKRAFTLIELLVVILILAILAALIVPRVVGRTDDAKIGRAKSDITTLANELDKFRLDTGRYPTTEEGLEALRTAPSDVEGWKGPYLKKAIPLDPWNGEYIYETPGVDGADYTIASLGADKAEGGEGPNADISNVD
ncbi:MAG: type II secretion system major pseudopilin GspG [Fimbriimonas sp.]